MKSLIITTLLSFVLLAGCSNESKKGNAVSGSEKLKVVSVNYPLHYFAQTIGGDLIDAVYPVPSSADPAYWKPNEKEILIYQSADLILLNGADYAKWVEKASLPESKKLNTSSKFKNNYLNSDEIITHSHGPDGEHEHKGVASTTWLSFQFAIDQASVIKDELITRLPQNKEEILKNFKKLESDLLLLDNKMRLISDQLGDINIIGSHPVYQYLDKEYQLNIKSLHWEPDEMPDKAAWNDFKHHLSKKEDTIMIWEADPLPEISLELEKLGVRSSVFELCANAPEKGNFISKMEKNIQSLENSLK